VLANQARGAGGEIQLTDAMIGLAQKQPFYGLKFEGKSFDCGSKIGFLAANVAYGLARDDIAPGFRAELKQLLDAESEDIVIVDVRDETEFKEGHIPTAINIPVETFALRSEVLPKEKKVIVYCNTGGRSYNAYRKLMKLAYPDIAQTLYADWAFAGMPVEK